MTASPHISDLLLPLLDGAFEDPPWQDFLERFRRGVGADYASLIFRPLAPSRPSLMHLFAGESSPPLVERLYRESLHRHDPVDYHRLSEGRAYALDELIVPGDPAHERYGRDLLAPSGMNDIRLMRIVEPGGVNVWLTTSRRVGRFGPAEGATIEALAPYLRTALRGFVALERERFKASVAGEAIRRLSFGWLTLDAAGRLLDADTEGLRLIDDGAIVRRSLGGRLAARDRDVDRGIADALQAIAAEPQGRPRALVLSRDPWLDMLLVPAHRRPAPASPGTAIIAYVHGDGWSSADRCEQIAELFQLLPSEARLALALSRGMSIAESAAELGITVETARTYSKSIYAKTGARGQPDLVRFVHRSVLAIA
jgi:DNA-binding CsgD family transcriptional regulator